MKRILLIAAVIMLLTGCALSITEPESTSPSLSEKDFSFYDEYGNEKVFPSVQKNRISLSVYPEYQTLNGIKIGDRATSALDKFDVLNSKGGYLYGVAMKTIYLYENTPDIFPIKDDTDLAELFKQAAINQETITVIMMFDEEFKPMDVMDDEQCENDPQNSAQAFEVWGIGFEISDEKIADITMVRVVRN